MKCLTLALVLPVLLLPASPGQEKRTPRTPQSWTLSNSRIQITISAAPGGTIRLSSLKNMASGFEWAAPAQPAGVYMESDSVSGLQDASGFTLAHAEVAESPAGGRRLTLAFSNPSQAQLTLSIGIFPGLAALEYSVALANRGNRPLPPLYRIDPLLLQVRREGVRALTPQNGRHGFDVPLPLERAQQAASWIVLNQEGAGESMLLGGDMALSMLRWNVNTAPAENALSLRAGHFFPSPQGSTFKPAYELLPGERIETPTVFLALARGDADDAANESFRYLARHVMPEPLENSPLATYCIWLTQARSIEPILEELRFARRAGFDVFYHDASWMEGSSIVPGMNDWGKGLGSYADSKEKFPEGLAVLAGAVRKSGMKFGIWVDPGNVASARVESGEISSSWLAKLDGKPLETRHPSLAPMTQICFGNPAVVAAVKRDLAGIIERWGLEWLKWDPSGTVTYACNRADHGHSARNGLYAAYRGRLEILAYLQERFPRLSGYECDPSLRYSRTNPGPREVLPGGYTNEFITGPMVSPHVWGSLASAGRGDARASRLTGDWYSASTLDYHLRKHFTHGVTFGNINGMSSQMLSNAPPGYIEAFQRSLHYFKQYRHLLLQDVYHPKLTSAAGWSAIQYAKPDKSESVLFIFREGGAGENSAKLRGLDPSASYTLTSLNDRPGRERQRTGADLINSGISVALPDPWLAKGDGLPDPRYEDQLRLGSDIILIRRVEKQSR